MSFVPTQTTPEPQPEPKAQPQAMPQAQPEPTTTTTTTTTPVLGKLTQELLTMLTYKRPAGTLHERKFINRFIRPLGVEEDKFGNLWKQVGAVEASTVLWSSHTDTVHKLSGKQRILYGDGLATSEGNECLGGDCTTGVWIMMQMIRAGVPGRYVFHREEECGGNGSSHVALKEPERLAGITFAIALDRKGDGDVITCQAMRRTASDTFAKSLCDLLAPLTYAPDDGGVFTDTANYADHIPECSNISVGYYKAHSASEFQDVPHALRLLQALIRADFTTLVAARDHTVPDPEDDRFDDEYGAFSWLGEKYGNGGTYRSRPRAERTLEDYVYENPEMVALFLEQLGYSAWDLEMFRTGKSDDDRHDPQLKW